jgi:hypothetical protein
MKIVENEPPMLLHMAIRIDVKNIKETENINIMFVNVERHTRFIMNPAKPKRFVVVVVKQKRW